MAGTGGLIRHSGTDSAGAAAVLGPGDYFGGNFNGLTQHTHARAHTHYMAHLRAASHKDKLGWGLEVASVCVVNGVGVAAAVRRNIMQ